MDVTLPSSYGALPLPRLPQAGTPAAENGTGPGTSISKVDPAKLAQIRKSANEFENMFASQMVGHLFSGIEVDETFGGGHGEEMFRSMLTNEYANQITKRGGFGIADQVYRELLRAQEGTHG